MRMTRLGIITLVAVLLVFSTSGEKRPIDTGHSHLTVHVGKSGAFSGFGHAHEITAPIVRGEVETSKPLSVQFDVNAAGMKVVDTDESEKDRADVQKTMLSPDVLDVARFPEIKFVSGQVEEIGESRWRVHGSLTLHGQTKPIELETTLEKGHYRGTATVLQTNFEITPIKVAGGSIKVKDEVQIEFDIMLAGQ
jgi:polyisoprenoid-binding protein YceI